MGMILTILLMIGVIILVLIIIKGYLIYKLKKKINEIIPKEVLGIFNQAEEKLKGGIDENGEISNPYKVLWEIARSREGNKTIKRDERFNRTESETPSGSLHEQSLIGQDFSSRTTKGINEPSKFNRKVKYNNIRSLIRRRKVSRKKIE